MTILPLKILEEHAPILVPWAQKLVEHWFLQCYGSCTPAVVILGELRWYHVPWQIILKCRSG